MHETGIAWEILQTARNEAEARSATLAAVGVRVGVMSGVVAASLEFAFDALKSEAGAPEATLTIENVGLEAHCPGCNTICRPEPDLVLWCPSCGSPLHVCAGEELELAWIETATTACER
jgi:hydrogenase nickel insertion protein HypA